MKESIVIGNWKSNKTIDQAHEWFHAFARLVKRAEFTVAGLEIVLCPAFVHLGLAHEIIARHKLPLQLGAQNISPFGPGAYTGEVAADMIKNFVSYTLIGHSERREHFRETDALLAQKVAQARKNDIEPVFCVPTVDTSIPKHVRIVAYEPVWAIGSGKPETPENANRVCRTLAQRTHARVIYGGSVTPDNVARFLAMEHISGVLPGGASLQPDTFLHILSNAQTSRN